MSKRIITQIGGHFRRIRNATGNEGTNWDVIRAYGAIKRKDYAVIIADDNIFEGL